jgi:hypothetical protein
MNRDLVKELILKSLMDDVDTIVLVMPKAGNPLIATTIRGTPRDVVDCLRSWLGLFENAVQNDVLIAAGKEAVIQ